MGHIGLCYLPVIFCHILSQAARNRHTGNCIGDACQHMIMIMKSAERVGNQRSTSKSHRSTRGCQLQQQGLSGCSLCRVVECCKGRQGHSVAALWPGARQGNYVRLHLNREQGHMAGILQAVPVCVEPLIAVLVMLTCCVWLQNAGRLC